MKPITADARMLFNHGEGTVCNHDFLVRFTVGAQMALLMFLTFALPAFGTLYTPNKGVGAGGSEYDYGRDVEVDSAGNIYTTGYFSSASMDLDPGSGTFTANNNGGYDFFVQKLDADGNFEWAVSLGGIGDDMARGLEGDSSGNVYVVGEFSDTVDFDPDSGVQNLSSLGNTDAFVLKLDSLGDFVWVKKFRSAGYVSCYDVALDSSNNVYSVGWCGWNIDADPSASDDVLGYAGGLDVFVVKLDSSGNYVWGGSMGGPDFEVPNAVTVSDSGNVFITGYFEGTADFNPDPVGVHDLVSAGDKDVFVLKLTLAGSLVWAKEVGGAGADEGRAIYVDSSENVYTVGDFEGTADLEPDSGVSNFTSAGLVDIFVQKLDSAGAYQWALSFGGTDYEYGRAVTAAPDGRIYVGGAFRDTVDFDPGSGTDAKTSAGNADAFFVELGTGGAYYGVTQFGAGGSEYLEGLAFDNSGRPHITGYSFYNLYLDDDTFWTNAGQTDAFTVQFKEYHLPIAHSDYIEVSEDFTYFVYDSHYLFYRDARDSDLRAYNRFAEGSTVQHHTGLGDTDGIAIDVRHGEDFVFWTDRSNGRVHKFSLNTSTETTLITGQSDPRDMELDHANQRMYWVERGAGKINSADYDGSNLTTVLSGLTAPFGLALDPENGHIYYAEQDPTQRISRCDFDGSNVTSIYTGSEVANASDVELDIGSQMLYWGNTIAEYLYRMPVDGSSVTTYTDPAVNEIRGLAIDKFQGFVYYSAPSSSEIRYMDLDGSNPSVFLAGPPAGGIALGVNFQNVLNNDTNMNQTRLFAFEWFDSNLGAIVSGFNSGEFRYEPQAVHELQILRQGASKSDYFWYGTSDGKYGDYGVVDITVYGRNDLCNPANDNIDVYASAGTQYIVNSWAGLIFRDDRNGELRNYSKFSDGSVENNGIAVGETDGITFDGVNDELYWTDRTNGTLEKSGWYGGGQTSIVTGQSDPRDIEIDQLGERLYWVERGAGKIHRCDLDGGNAVTLLSGLTGPFGIALDLVNGYIYYVEQAPVQTLSRANLDGSNVTVIYTGDELANASDLELDVGSQMLWWGNTVAENLYRMPTSAAFVHTFQDPVFNSVRGLALDKYLGKVFYSDPGANQIRFMEFDGTNPDTFLSGPPTAGIGLADDQRNPLLNDQDIDLDNIWVYDYAAYSQRGVWVTVYGAGDIRYDWTDDAELYYMLQGETATDNFTYSLADGYAGPAATVSITFHGDKADSDGDGIADEFEDFDGSGSTDYDDLDNDGIVNWLDTDSDGDGILDADEWSSFALDTDGDGWVDAYDIDSDNDGYLDSTEYAFGSNHLDDASTPTILTIWVDPEWWLYDPPSTYAGTEANPLYALTDGINWVDSGGTVMLKGKSTGTKTAYVYGDGRIEKPLRIDTNGYPVQIVNGDSLDPEVTSSIEMASMAEPSDSSESGLEWFWGWLGQLGQTSHEDAGQAGGDSGFYPHALVYEPFLPRLSSAEGVQQANSDQPLAVRLRSDEYIDENDIAVSVPGYNSEDASWGLREAEGVNTASDWWVVFDPIGSWRDSDLVQLRVTGHTLEGTALPVLAPTFGISNVTGSTADTSLPQPVRGVDYDDTGLIEAGTPPVRVNLSPLSNVSDALPGAVGGIFEIAPDELYDSPRRVWLPVPSGYGLDTLALYYYKPNHENRGWYAAENVLGWKEPGSELIVTSGNTTYYGILINHGATCQFGAPVPQEPQSRR